MQEGQFEGIVAHCLSTPGVHLIELPIDYSITDQLQVWAARFLPILHACI